jgi:hypothetical protein
VWEQYLLGDTSLPHLQGRYRLVALTPSWDLFDCATDLFIAAMVDRSFSNIGSLVSKIHGIALIMLNSRISCIHSCDGGLRASLERRSLAMAFVSARMINRR